MPGYPLVRLQLFMILRQIVPLKKNYMSWSPLAGQTNFHSMCSLHKMVVLIRRYKLMLRHDMNRLYVSTKLTAVLDLYCCCFKLTLNRKIQLLNPYDKEAKVIELKTQTSVPHFWFQFSNVSWALRGCPVLRSHMFT